MFVFSNLATSLDGKIATQSREHFWLGTDTDRKQMQVLRKQAQAIVMGANTLRTYKNACLAEGATQQPVNVVVSSALEGIKSNWPFFKEKSIERVLFVGPKASAKKIKEFQKTSQVIKLKKPTPKNPTAKQILSALDRLGLQKILVEGGGGLMWDFVSQDLIDEYHLTLTPRLIGGTESPTLVDGLGLPPKKIVNLSLEQCSIVGDELFLIYRKTGRRG